MGFFKLEFPAKKVWTRGEWFLEEMEPAMLWSLPVAHSGYANGVAPSVPLATSFHDVARYLVYCHSEERSLSRIIVELMGPAGVGKTYACQAISDRFDALPAPSRPVKIKAWWASVTLRILIFLFPRKRHGLVKMFQRKLAIWSALRSVPSGSYLIEEGPWNFLCSSLGSRVPQFAAAPVARFWSYHLGLPDAVIYLDAKAEFLSERIRHRGRNNERLQSPEDLQKARERIEFFLTRVMHRYPSTPVFRYRVENDLSISKMTCCVEDIIRAAQEKAGRR